MDYIIVWILIAVAFGLLGRQRWRLAYSVSKPVVDTEAQVAKMLGKIGPISLGRSVGFKTIPGYYITFDMLSGDESGKRRTFYVDADVIDNVSVGDNGVLTLQGARFIRFVPKN